MSQFCHTALSFYLPMRHHHNKANLDAYTEYCNKFEILVRDLRRPSILHYKFQKLILALN
jgi:hypothetical protein